MKVEMELPDHPKYLRFKRQVGLEAMEYLVRMWGHCEASQRGELWRGADAEYLEAVCRWEGDKGALYRALMACGWISVDPDGIRVHDWNKTNWRAVSNWQLSRRMRQPHGQGYSQGPSLGPPQGYSQGPSLGPPQGTPVGCSQDPSLGGSHLNEGMNEGMNEPPIEGVSQGSPVGCSQGTNQGYSQGYEWPTHEEWEKAAEMEGLPKEEIELEWANQERKAPEYRWRGIDRRRLRQHAAFVRQQMQMRGRGRNKSVARPMSEGMVVMEKRRQLEQLEAEWQDHPGNPASSAAVLEVGGGVDGESSQAAKELQRKITALRQELGAR